MVKKKRKEKKRKEKEKQKKKGGVRSGLAQPTRQPMCPSRLHLSLIPLSCRPPQLSPKCPSLRLLLPSLL
jgi:hypothetical protein